MKEDIRAVQAAIYKVRSEARVATGNYLTHLRLQERELHDKLEKLKRPPVKRRPWIFLVEEQGETVVMQPFYPPPKGLPPVVLLEAHRIIAEAAATVAFMRELGLRTGPTVTEFAQERLRKTFELEQLLVVSTAGLLDLAKKGEVQVRFTTAAEDAELTRYLEGIHDEEKERGTPRLRPNPERLRSGGVERHREPDGPEGPPI